MSESRVRGKSASGMLSVALTSADHNRIRESGAVAWQNRTPLVSYLGEQGYREGRVERWMRARAANQ